MDFFNIAERREGNLRNPVVKLYPDWQSCYWSDFMVRGGEFYAVWDDERKQWTRSLHRLVHIVDQALHAAAQEVQEKNAGVDVVPLYMKNHSSGSMKAFESFCKLQKDPGNHLWTGLDEKLVFANEDIQKSDYVTEKMAYELSDGDTPCWDEITSTLYTTPDIHKIMWMAGAVVANESLKIQKMLVMHGAGGKGKSTVLDILSMVFEDHVGAFSVKALLDSNNQFQAAAFSNNDLVMMDHESDFSRFYGDTGTLKALTAHNEITMNEKGVRHYQMRVISTLFAATNKPVSITDSQDGIVRRLLDVEPTGNLLAPRRYEELMSGVKYEVGHIAYKCKKVYMESGPSYYRDYIPLSLIKDTNTVYEFLDNYADEFVSREVMIGVDAWKMYRSYCEANGITRGNLGKMEFLKELASYYEEYHERKDVGGSRPRHVFIGFKASSFFDHEKAQAAPIEPEDLIPLWLELQEQPSLLDIREAEQPAMYAVKREDGWGGETKWANNTKKLKDLDTSRAHWVQYSQDHIVIDFDIKNADGEKDYELNRRKAAHFPATYAEASQGGSGLHLHYIYAGDASELAALVEDDVEIKVYRGNASDRRRLSLCNTHDISTMPVGGLPLKEKKNEMINTEFVETEKTLRRSIEKALRKEVHSATAPNVDFIKKILDEAYSNGVVYDVSDLRGKVQSLAAKSTNQSLRCLKLVTQMKFQSEQSVEEAMEVPEQEETLQAPLAFFDIEVFPNLLLICWKVQGEGKQVGTMINPTPSELEPLLKMRLVGFNNRMYDNHILMGRYQGDTIEECYKRSQRIIVEKDRDAYIPSAYGLSYGDIRDLSSTPMKSLKKWEIELGIHHQELDHDWTKPAPEELWEKIGEYCANDVVATEAVWDHSRSDVKAREILAALSGLPFNDTTRKHASKILFGVTNGDSHKDEFVYTDLSQEFPGYKFEKFKGDNTYTEDEAAGTTIKELHQSTYRGEVVGEGGYVYSEPGVYEDVALIDVASMHPTSIEVLNLFGKYTKNFSDLKSARVHIKRKEWAEARACLDGRLAPYLTDESEAKALSNALKLVINKVYGFTSATFDNTFRDKRNIDNIVAKRGALFMIDLKHYVQEQGYTVAHIKTDSIKIPNASPDIIEKVMEFGKKYGYDFEHEATYDRMALVDRAQYIAHDEEGWHATGKMFLRPYVLKKLFTKEDFTHSDYAVDFQVQTSLWLDFNENLPDGEHDRHHIGRVGNFYPVRDGFGGAELVRQDKEDSEKFHYAAGAKDQRWLETEQVDKMDREDIIDTDYHQRFADEAQKAVEELPGFSTFGLFEVFTGELPF